LQPSSRYARADVSLLPCRTSLLPNERQCGLLQRLRSRLFALTSRNRATILTG
jgi:hypothetical protein